MSPVFLSCLLFNIILASIGFTTLWWERRMSEVAKKYINKDLTFWQAREFALEGARIRCTSISATMQRVLTRKDFLEEEYSAAPTFFLEEINGTWEVVD